MQNKKIFTETAVILLVILFLYTGLSKFMDFKGFTHDLNNQPFPDGFTPFLRWFIPLIEIVIVIALIFEKTRITGLYSSLILMSLFSVYTGLVLLHMFEYVPCSCGGVIKYLSWPQHLIFNLFFVVLSFLAIRFSKEANPVSLNV